MGYGAGAVNPYLAFETLARSDPPGPAARRDPRPGGHALRQGAQQGRAEGDVEDGDLDAAELLRRADLRSGRPRPRVRRQVLHRHRVAHRRRRPGGDLRGGPAASRARVRPPARRRRPSSRAAASTSGGATAKSTSSIPRRCSGCSTPRAPGSTTIFKEYTRLVDDQSQRRATLRGLFALQAGRSAGPARRGRAGRVDPAALLDRRDVVRLDQPGSARDAGDRDEPDGRQVEHRRGRRGSGALRARRQRRLAPQRHQAGRLGPLRRDQRVPRQRRRSADQDGAGRQARRGRAAARATRSIRGSPRCGTRRRASA